MVNIAIVDDEEKEHEKTKLYLSQISKDSDVEFVIHDFFHADHFLMNYSHSYDIILLDIDMPGGTNGMEVAKQIRKIDDHVLIIFVTNMANFALEGYSVNAFDFIVKPTSLHSFSLKLRRAIHRVQRSTGKLLIKVEREYISVDLSSIIYVEVYGHYIIYHTKLGKFREYNTLKTVEKLLDPRFFVRCNRCYIINLWYIAGVRGEMLILQGGTQELPISLTYRKHLLQSYANFISGEVSK